jgi:hypothetical protein
MTAYDSSRDEIITLGGRVLSVSQAEQLATDLQRAVSTAREYREREDLHDVNLNERALNYLLDPTESDHILCFDGSHDITTGSIPLNLTEKVIEHRPIGSPEDAKMVTFTVHAKANQIPAFFEQSRDLIAFRVDLP